MKNILKKIISQKIRFRINQLLDLIIWLLKGKPLPAPSLVKRNIIKKYANKYSNKIFIETGTYLGDTVDYFKNNFEQIFSIELDDNLYINAQNRFKEYKNINILKGDSGKVLPTILPKIDEPMIFWLDGHYSGGITSKGSLNTPIMKELELILTHKVKNHTILIDDARCFIGKNDYPDIKELIDFVKTINPGLNFKIKNDIIRITK